MVYTDRLERTGHDVGARELALGLPRWRVVLGAAAAVAFFVVPIGYGGYLATGRFSWLVLGLATVVALSRVPLHVLHAWVTLTGPAPALTHAGIRVRPRAWRRETVDVPWEQATMIWIEYRGRHPVLNVVPSGSLGHRGRRPDRAVRPYLVPLPSWVRPDTVRESVWTLSDGRADVLDRGLGYDGGTGPVWRRGRETPAPWWRVGVSAVTLLLLGSVGVPVVIGGPPPWNQPWWPGNDIAIRVPDPCQALRGTEGTSVSALPGESSRSGSMRGCRVVAGTSELTVTYRVHHPFFGGAAEAAAEDADDAAFQGDADEELPGVGDEAWIGPAKLGSGRSAAGMQVVGRRANVVVEVRYISADEPERIRTLVTATAREALAQVDVG